MHYDEQREKELLNPWLMQGDCLERMKEIADGSVDAIICDPPYGAMNGFNGIDWDYTINNDAMWSEINRVLRVNGCCVLFSQEPYTSKLITQGHNNVPFSYRAIWQKDNFANALLCNKAMVSYFEDICVFFKKHTKHDFEGMHPLRPYFAEVLKFIGKPKSELMQTIGQRIDHCTRVNSTQFGLCTEATYNELIDRYSINKMQGFRQYKDLEEANTVYCVFMYLMTIGIVYKAASDSLGMSTTTVIGMLINLIFAPLITPVIIGVLIYEKNT